MATISSPHLLATPPRTSTRLGPSPAAITMGSVLLLAFVGLFFRWFLTQHRHSLGNMEDWGHVYLIPLISGYLVWQRRRELLAAEVRTFWPALAPMLLGVMSYFFCVVGVKNHMLAGFSMILTLFSLLLLLLGPSPMRLLFLPIAYLGFGVTISEMIMIKLTFQLQLLASKGAGILMTIIGPIGGFTTEVDGNTLTVFKSDGQAIPLNVAEACSGMRMVIAFIALAAAVALTQCRHWWQRVALVLLAIPVAVLLNVVRVAVLGIATLFDKDLATGDAHMLIGTLLLVPGFALFLTIVWILKRVVSDDPGPAKPASLPVRWTPAAVEWRSLRTPAFLAAVGVLSTAALGFGVGMRMANIYLQKLPIVGPDDRAVAAIPPELPSWTREGVDRRERVEVEKELGTTNYVTRSYRERNPKDPKNPRRLELHLAYYTGMIDTVPHVPDRCFVGGGMSTINAGEIVHLPLDASRWQLDDDVPAHLKGRIWRAPVYNQYGAVVRRVRLPRDPDKTSMKVTSFKAPGGSEVTAGYFFIANGGTVPTAEQVRLLAFNLNDDYAFYLKVQFTAYGGRPSADFAADAADLLNELLPEIMRCVPDWVDVERGLYPADNPRAASQRGHDDLNNATDGKTSGGSAAGPLGGPAAG